MAEIRKRKNVNAEYTAQDLCSEMKLVQQTATENGINAKEFMKCLSSAAEKKEVKLAKELKKSPKPSKPPGACPKIMMFYKAMIILNITALVFYLLFTYSPYFSSAFIKLIHVHLYSIIRPMRLLIAAFAPALKMFGMDVFNRDCLLENPFLKEIDTCPCLHIKLPKELELTASQLVVPDSVFQLPSQDIFVVRNAVDTTDVKLEDFQDFKRNHPTQRGPKTCQKLTTDSTAGPQKMVDLYNTEMMKDFLVSNKTWAFTWEECPIKDRPQTFRSLYPEPDYLSMDVQISDVTVYTIHNQWSIATHSQSSLPDGAVVAMLVIIGEVRITIEFVNENCFELCTPFREQIVLKAGDVLLFDQLHWAYTSTAWSQYALTATMAVYHPDTP